MSLVKRRRLAQHLLGPRTNPPAPPAPGVLQLFWTPEQIHDALGSPVENVRIMWPLLCKAMADFGILDRDVALGMLGTIGVEASVFWPIEEYRNADGSIPRGWYGYSGGQNYHGRGPIQATHDYNYLAFQQWVRANLGLDIDFIGNPDLMLEPVWSAYFAAWYFSTHGGGPWTVLAARRHDWPEVRRLVNGGYTHLDEMLGYIAALERVA